MAFERIGLGGVLSFDGRAAVVEMANTGRAFMGLGNSASATVPPLGRFKAALDAAVNGAQKRLQAVSAGFKQVTGALGGAALSGIGLSLGMGAAINEAAQFQKQMSNVKSVVDDKTGPAMNSLRELALHLGETTVFSSTEAAQAMEALAKAGINTSEKLKGTLPAVLDMAAIEGMDLVSASETLVRAMSGMGYTAEQSGHMVNVLAMASNESTTSVAGLGGGFSYAAGTAHKLGLSAETLAAAIATMADKGLDATAAGTHFNQVLLHMTKVTPKGQKVLKDLGVTFMDGKGNFRDFNDIMTDLNTQLGKKFPGSAERAEAVAKLFGTEGATAFDALAASMEEGDKSFVKLAGRLKDAPKDFAKQMSDVRLDNFLGNMAKFRKAVGNMFIRFFEPIVGSMAPGLANMTKMVQRVSGAFRDLIGDGSISADSIKASYGATALSIAQGLKDAMGTIKGFIAGVQAGVAGLAQFLGTTVGDGARGIAKWGTLFLVAAAAASPLILGLGGLAYILTGVVIPAVSGLAGIIGAVFWPAVVIVGALAFAFAAVRNEGETFGQTVLRVFTSVKTWAQDTFSGFIAFAQGAWSVAGVVFEGIGEAWAEVAGAVRYAITELAAHFGGGVETMGVDWRSFGANVVMIIGSISQAFASVVKWVIVFATHAIKFVDMLATGVAAIAPIFMGLAGWIFGFWKLFKDLSTAVTHAIAGDWTKALLTFMVGITDYLITPLRLLVKTISKAASAMGMEVPGWVQTFANEGLVGLMNMKQPTVAPPSPAPEGTPAQQVAAMKAAEKQKAANPEVKADVKLENKIENKVDAKVHLDGREVARATSRHQQEVLDRAGAKSDPWQRRIALENGAMVA